MTQGLENRQVVNVPRISGQANQPARQLGQVNVNAPRGGSVNGVGAGYDVLAQAAKMGGKALDGYLKNKEAEDLVTGEMLQQQGKTEEDLANEGYNQTVLKGFQTLKLKTSYSEWFTKSSLDAVDEYHTLSPEDYRKSVLEPQFKEVLNGLDPADDLARSVFTEMGKEGFNKLVERQMIAHTQFLDQDSVNTVTNMLYADAGTGDPEIVQATLENLGEYTSGMSEEAIRGAEMGAMVPQLNQGNFLLYDAMGGKEGLIRRGYSPSQIESVTRAVETAQSVREREAGVELDAKKDEIRQKLKQGLLGPTEAMENLTALTEEYRTSTDWIRGVAKEIRAEAFEQELTDQELTILHDPDYVNTMSQLAIMAHTQGNTPEVTNAALFVAEKFKLPIKMVKDNLGLIRNAQDRKVSKLLQDIDRQSELVRKEQELDIKASTALGTDTIHLQNEDIQQRAMTSKRQEIEASTEDPTERVFKHVDFLRSTSVIDNSVKQDFTEAANTSPIQDGQLTEESEAALTYFLAMKQGGISDATIRKYTGDAYDYFDTAAFLQNGSIDVSKALLSAYEVTRTDPNQLETPRTKVKDVKSQVSKDIDEVFFGSGLAGFTGLEFLPGKAGIEPTMLASWLGAASDAKYDEVLTSEVTEAVRNSGDMRGWAMERAEVYAKTYPDMKPEAISRRVKADLGRWEYVFGKMVPPKNGQSLSEMMGISHLPEALSTNSAVLHMMHSRMDDLLPAGSDGRAVVQQFFDNLGGEALESILAPEKFVHGMVSDKPFKRGENTKLSTLGQIALAPINAIEARQRMLKNLVPMDITPYGNDVVLITIYNDNDKTDPIGTPIPVSAKAIGANYINRLK